MTTTLSCDEIQKANLEELFRINRNHKKDSKDRYSLEYFETRLERVNSLWQRCSAQHPEVLGAKAHNSTLLKDYQDSYEQAEELSLDLITSFKTYINDYKEQKSTRIAKPTTSAGEEFQSTKIVIKDNFQLERIKIPRFDGNYMKWTTFHELFNAMVHKNNEICKVQKMQYLKSLLTDEASNLIKHLPVSEENYEAAYDLLQNRFANKRVIMSSHLHAITSATPTKAENANSYKGLLDITTESLAGIKGLGQAVDSWGPIIVHILAQKLDIESRKKWEDSQGSSREFPTLSQLTTFLEERFRSIEAMGTAKIVHKTHSHSVNTEGRSCCILCNDNHRLFKCNKFQDLNVQQKRSLVEKHKLCFNCLQFGHASRSCFSKTRCLKCKAGHHTSLHMEISKPREILTATNAENGKDVLLATALIQVKNKFGDYVTFRALIDQGSQRSFITEATVQCLKLPRSYDKTIISGIGSSEKTVSKGAVNLKIREKWTSNHQSISALIIPQITCDLPYKNISPNSTKINVDDLADPTFYIKGKIDILLGADIFSNIIKNGVKDAQSKYLTAQRTSLGWILSGPIPIEQSYKAITLISTEDVDRSLQKFWEQEEVEYHIEPSSQDLLAEEIYKRDVQRLPSGRYQVSLPFKMKPGTELQGTRPRALQRLYQLERRFKVNSELKDDYNKVMNEYFDLEQIEEVPTKEINKLNYYLPHHAVLKASSTTTKTRVVFDASATSPAGKSLNDFLLTGPTIQESLYEILMRWRKYKFAITGDIEKMYRQIWLKPEDRDFHRILWRKHPTDEVMDYRLKTVTFGVASAPFLAIRTLHEIALSIKPEDSKLANIILKDFYVDDVMTGASTLEEAKVIRKDLSEIFIKAGFPLRKWAANHNSILSNIAEADRELQLPLDSEKDVQVKTLGLYWLPATDVFSYKVLQLKSQKENHTKRSILSEVSKLFDPLGWLQPILIKSKSLLQQLWLTQIEWDCPLPNHIQDQWNNLRNDLYNIQKIHIPRWINFEPGDDVQLHGFSDASLIAYAAVIYIRIEKPNGNIITHLLSSKTKVAPIKTVSIPRLELCGAQLVVQLMNQVSQAFKWAKINKFFWTDSTIVLSWLSQHPNKWKTYVANRVSYILSNSTRSQWRHVQSKDNPADIASRGVSADQLRLLQLWWKGPEWLSRNKILWPLKESTPNINLEARTTTLSAIINIQEPQWITQYSSFTKMIRITALCLRFKNNLKAKEKLISSISTIELDTAEKTCINIMQNHFFKDEIERLRINKEIKLSSRLKALNPFLDVKGILRVGGRLTLAPVSYDQKHPIIIDGRSYLAILIIRYYHQKLLHSGTQATQTAIRLKYWIIGGLTVIKRILRNCLVCFRANPTFQNQIMGSLPEARVSPKRPFSSVGLDFGGPLLIKFSSGRGAKSCKAYIALFVCLSTKAIHLELVSDLTSDASLAAIRRFIARRGLCTDIYSDQGTNFIGAKNVLQKAFLNTKEILANEKINWHFIPPGSPHFGGLWEAGIKSTKRLLKRVIGEQLLTYEEMATLLTQIESCLNSRPLCSSSNDCNDLEAITPGHFLIGQHLYAIPETFGSQGGKWKLIQQLKNSFWERWTREYISSLQERNKWRQPKENIKLNQLVLVKDERFPSNKWPLGRIIELHPGEDGIVRVVSIKTNKGIIQRNITKTCSLPNNEDDSSRKIFINKDQKSSKIAVNLWTTMFCFLTLFSLIFGQDVNITKFNGKPGIYFENMGKIKLMSSKWKIVLYYELETYWWELDEIGKGIKNLELLCADHMVMNLTFCLTHVNHLSSQYTRLQQNNEILFTNHAYYQRKKRGALNIVGTVANSLFGVLAQEDAQKYDLQISSLRENEQQVLSLLKNQTSTIDSTIKLMKQESSQIQYQFKILEEQLNHIHKMEQKEIVVLSLVLHYLMAMKRYKEIQDELITSFINAKTQRHYLILTTTELIQQISLIRSNMPYGTQLPIKEQDPNFLHDIFAIMTSKTALSGSRLIIEFSIPLVDTKIFTVYNLIPLPTVYQNKHIMIQPNIKNLAITTDRNYYFEITQREIDQCLHTSTARICQAFSPIYGLESQKYRCEVALLTQHRNFKEDCKFSIVEPSNHWIPLSNEGQYIFIIMVQQTLIFECGEQSKSIKLQDEGIITIPPGCAVKHPTYTVSAHSSIQSKILVQNDVIPEINMSEFGTLVQNLNFSQTKSTFNEDVARIQKSLEMQHKNLQEISNNSRIFNPEHHEYILISIIICICLILISICTFTKIWSKICRRSSSSTSNPEFSLHQYLRRSIHWPKLTEEPISTANQITV